jgi:enoyl-CoA hydratase
MAEAASPTVRFIPVDPGDWGFLQFDRPETKNALDHESVLALAATLESVPGDTRLVVFRGSGNSFISGADIAAMYRMDLPEAAAFAQAGHQLTRAIESHPACIGALVDGYALGGGTEILLACDVVVATNAAVLGLPEVRLGIIPGWGGTQRFVRAVGLHRGLRYLMSGARFDGAEAERLGLVDALVADTDAAVSWWEQFAAGLRKASPAASARAKRAARDGAETSIDNALMVELRYWLEQFASEDRRAGMGSFLQKQSPPWASPGRKEDDHADR